MILIHFSTFIVYVILVSITVLVLLHYDVVIAIHIMIIVIMRIIMLTRIITLSIAFFFYLHGHNKSQIPILRDRETAHVPRCSCLAEHSADKASFGRSPRTGKNVTLLIAIGS